MALRTLRRRVIIREYDYKKVEAQALAPLSTMGIVETLYDRVSFLPLSQDNLEQIKMIEILKGKENPLSAARWNFSMPGVLLYDLRDYLYSDKYYNWKASIDEEGYLCVQARSNTPKSRIGWGVFEKDLTCRL